MTDDEPDCCGSEPPEFMTDSDGSQWRAGDCWCTLPAGHDGLCRCEPCSDRHGAPGWVFSKHPEAGESQAVPYPYSLGCTPGASDEQLPAHVLMLLAASPLTYLSTACEVGGQLADIEEDFDFHGLPLSDPDAAMAQLGAWIPTMHNRCRLTNKFTGVPCTCSCHRADAS